MVKFRATKTKNDSMKELSKVQNTIFRLGGVLFLCGTCTYLFNQMVGMILFTLGVLGFTTMQMLCRYDGEDITMLRLRRQQLLSDIFFLLSAAAMTAQVLESGPMWARRNLWILLLVIGCVLQLYTAFRIPSEWEKLRRRKGGRNLVLLFMMLFLCEGCATQQYNVSGTTNVTMLEGNTLYLKTFSKDSLNTLDSCRVQHGRISFSGELDSTQIVLVFMDNAIEMPLVLEEGPISLTIDEYTRNVTGSPLNDTLYNFIRLKHRLDNELSELSRLETRLIMDGVDAEERDRILYSKSQDLIKANDHLVTSFIIRNSDNVLGPGVFMFMTSALPFPQLTPQIEEIMFRATPYFKSNPYVRSYMEAAQQNMEKIHTGQFED